MSRSLSCPKHTQQMCITKIDTILLTCQQTSITPAGGTILFCGMEILLAQQLQQQLQIPLPQPAQTTPPPTVATFGPSLEDVVKQMATQNNQFQQQMAAQVAQNIQFQHTTGASINDLKTQVGQQATTVNQLQTQGSSTLPAQTIPNLNVSAITLRSGKKIDAIVGTSAETSGDKNDKVEKNKPIVAPPPASAASPTAPTHEPDDEPSIPLPFPQRATKSKLTNQLDKENEILDVFTKVEVNIPLLEAIKQ
ncbi:hypothetical protein A2U01_0025432, partial [Trifolium medium]|nr:hypothetical protein [Trifolium medium]